MDKFSKSRESIPYETKESTVSNQIALWFFQKLIPKALIASILEWLRDGITFLKA